MPQVAPPDQQARPSVQSAIANAQEHPMLDIAMLALAAGLFAAGIGYAYVCERL
jgi:hypothetical protein